MSQAEIAGGKVSPKAAIPKVGYRLLDFFLKSTDGREIRLSDYRGSSNVVLMFNAPSGDCARLTHELGPHYQLIREQQAAVLVIVSRPADLQGLHQLPFPILTDFSQDVYADYGLHKSADPVSGIFIADRFGELAASYVASDTANATSASILKWLEFINSQCPECEPPEWPLEDR